jgi:hypothetical protein
MTEKKPTPPIVYTLLTLTAAFAVWLVWNSYNEGQWVTQETIDSQAESTDRLKETMAKSDTWGEGVVFATTAVKLTQTATTSAEWKAVADMWMRAAKRMYFVPTTDPNFATAQQRVVQYRENAKYAKKNAKYAKKNEKHAKKNAGQ